MIQVDPVDQFSKWKCPHCGKMSSDNFSVEQTNTLTCAADHYVGRLHVLFSEVTCPICSETSYLIEVNLVNKAAKGVKFIADNCWTAKSIGKFRVFTEYVQWDIQLEQGVDFDEGTNAKWLARHYFGLFKDLNTGRVILESKLPALDQITRRCC
tara:strand:- start:524 stop:985 length:462 start_codon:yes stop_codon:yes gene_type:complete